MQAEILTPGQVIYSKNIDSCTLPSMDGEFGVFPGHCPLITAFNRGICSFRTKDDVGNPAVVNFICFDGFLKISTTKKNGTHLAIVSRLAVSSDELDSLQGFKSTEEIEFLKKSAEKRAS